MVRIVDALSSKPIDAWKHNSYFLQPKLVADERTNAILISGDPGRVRSRLRRLIEQLRCWNGNQGQQPSNLP